MKFTDIFKRKSSNECNNPVDGVNAALDSVFTIKHASGTGSGVIIAPGVAITNRHVVEGYPFYHSIVRVETASTSFDAELLRVSQGVDLAVIKIPDNLPPICIGDSSKIKAGEEVYAIGNPGGVSENTVTKGIISKAQYHQGSLRFIQFDAMIHPGNSGGALINSKGELIGIVEAVILDGAGNRMIGSGNIAIPCDVVMAKFNKFYDAFKKIKHGRFCIVCGWHTSDKYCDRCGGVDKTKEIVADTNNEQTRTEKKVCCVCGTKTSHKKAYCVTCGTKK